MDTREKRMTAKELAYELRKSVNYVYGMRACGFSMPGGTATLSAAVEWLQEHLGFTTRQAWPRGKARKREERRRHRTRTK